MASATPPVGSFRFSTESLPPRDRMAIWHEVYGRSITRVEMTPVGETPFRVDAGIHLFPDLAMATLEASPLRGERSRELARDNAEGIELLIPINAEMAVSQGDKEMRLGRGDAALMRYHEPGLTHISEGTRFIDLTIPGQRSRADDRRRCAHPDRGSGGQPGIAAAAGLCPRGREQSSLVG